MTKLHQLAKLGQAVWLDYIQRSLITSGELQDLIDKGLRGMTANPAIFNQAIAESDDYDDQIFRLTNKESTALEIYEALAIEDIQRAADMFRPLYQHTKGLDGYVSLEANPHLAHDTLGTITEVRRLHQLVARPNVMFKVPATPEGIPAIEKLLSEGNNINITLMFSMAHYEAVAEAYLTGLERLVDNGGDLSKTASVASFFVSRVDSKVDAMLDELNATELKGRIAIANATQVYTRFQALFNSQRWQRLADQGAQVQRVLWASTSTKNPDYPPTLYVDKLIGSHTVNTLPPLTLEAFLRYGTVESLLEDNLNEAQTQLQWLNELGIDLTTLGEELQREGVDKFIHSFDSLLDSITAKRSMFLDVQPYS